MVWKADYQRIIRMLRVKMDDPLVIPLPDSRATLSILLSRATLHE